MSTNNKVFQVLVAKADSAILRAGLTVEDLAVGQIGIFDAETNLSIDKTATNKKNFYLAVAIDSDGDTVVDKFMFSAGQNIQKDFIRNVELKDYVAPVNFVCEVYDFTNVKNGAEYAVKLEFRNMQIYQRQGTNQFTKTFAVSTTEDASVSPIYDFSKKLLDEMNADESGMFTAGAYTAAGVPIADLAVWCAANPTLAPHIRITGNELAIYKYYGINPRYYYPRLTVIIPSILGFTSEAKVGVITPAVAEQGNAYEIKQKEYQAGGWNRQPGPYRTSSTLGFPYEGIEFNAVDNLKYIQIHLVYDYFSTAGWGEYLSNLMTIIAIPNTYSVLTASLVEALNAILGISLTDPLVS